MAAFSVIYGAQIPIRQATAAWLSDGDVDHDPMQPATPKMNCSFRQKQSDSAFVSHSEANSHVFKHRGRRTGQKASDFADDAAVAVAAVCDGICTPSPLPVRETATAGLNGVD